MSSDYAIAYQVLGVLLVLFFGFITYMNTKTWKWVQVTFLFLVFAAAPAYWVYAAMTLKTRAAWMKLYQDLHAQVEQAEERVELLKRGELTDVKAEKDSVYARTEELRRLILDRGRVWRNCAPAGVQAGSITLNMPAAAAPPPAAPMPMPMPMPVDPMAPVDPAAQPVDPAAQPVDPAAQPVDPMAQPMPMPMADPNAIAGGHNIVDKMVLYAFKEVDTPAGFKAPQFYLGEFYVTSTTGTTISLAPTMPLAPDQAQEVNAGNSTWMLFETCPIDTYEIFAGLDKATLSQFITQAETGLQGAAYDALLDTYLLDGQRAPDNTPPDFLWAEVKFLKTHKEDVDAAAANDTPDAAAFDSTGLAQPQRLRRLESDITEFEAGDTAILPQEKADELVAAGVAEKVQPIYRRRLIEYASRFRTIHRRKVEIDGNVRDVNRDIATLQAANAKADEQITLETEHKRQLDEDIAKVTFERDGVARYGSSLFAKLTETNNQIKTLYASNHALNLELRQLTAKATEEADRRTREATAAATRP